MNPSLRIYKSEHLWLIVRKINFTKRHHDDATLNAVEVAQFELPARELRVPVNSIQQLVYWHHGKFRDE